MTPRLVGLVTLILLAVPFGAGGGEEDLRSLEPLDLHEAAALARRSAEPAWLVYSVSSAPHRGSFCCRNRGCCDVELEEAVAGHHHPLIDDKPVLIMLRFDGGKLSRARIAGDECEPSFGGRRVLWAGDVSPTESLRLLRPWLEGPTNQLTGDLLPAIAYHRGGEATGLLTELATDGDRPQLAKDAIFWLGTARGEAGYDSLVNLLASRPCNDLLTAIAFALHQSPVPAATETLAAIAIGDPEPEVRREALFWLGQSGTEHASTIYEAALADADDGVARHAVFVLSQISEPDNVEYLARLLGQSRRPTLRKEALFWIGQSDSPDALDIISRVLNQ